MYKQDEKRPAEKPATRTERLHMIAQTAAIYTLFFLALFLSLQSTSRIHVTSRLRSPRLHVEPIVQRPRPPRVALVTMADTRFLNCSLQLIRAARASGWRQPVFLMTVGDGISRNAGLGREAAQQLGVELVGTSRALDPWVDNMNVPRVYHSRRLSAAKFRKMDIFFNPLFRTFDRVIYMDPDGVIAAPLGPLAEMSVPAWAGLVMRQNDASVGKPSLWGGEVAPGALLPQQRDRLGTLFPDHALVGGSCWFVADMGRLPAPRPLLRAARQLLCEFKGGFRFNDQTLLNLLFYGKVALLPWCAGEEARVLQGGPALKRYCKLHMNAQRWADGGLRFMYRHLSPREKAECLQGAEGEWDDAAPVAWDGTDGGEGNVTEADCPAIKLYDGSVWDYWKT